MEGFFELKDADDMLAKLRHEFANLRSDRTSAYAAFNFFVTAEHMADWVYPGKANALERMRLRRDAVLLQVCSHLANGGKHFRAEAPHHQSVRDMRTTGGFFSSRMFRSGMFRANFFPKGGLLVELTGDAAAEFGSSINAVALAELVLDFWEKKTAADGS